MTATYEGCEANGRVVPDPECPSTPGFGHLWLNMGDHVHPRAEHGRIDDVACYRCGAVKPCNGTIGENR